jgi:integrase
MLAIQRALNWAVKMGHIDRSPIAHMEKPKAGKREQIVTPEQYNKLLELIHDQRFRDVITLAWESGARPQEIVHVEGRHVDLQNSRLVIPAEEAKGKKRIRVVYLTEPAMAIVQRLVLKYPKGKLFRNEDGLPWNRYSVSCRFARLGKKIGVKVCLYTFRHSFCHRALKNGVDPITLANLMGHVDPTMIARVYSHLSQDQKYLKESLKRATA